MALFKGYLYHILLLSLHLWPSEMSWRFSMLCSDTQAHSRYAHAHTLTHTHTHTHAHTHTHKQLFLPSLGVHCEAEGGEVRRSMSPQSPRVSMKHTEAKCVCVCVRVCVCVQKRKRRRERGGVRKRRPKNSILAFVVFFWVFFFSPTLLLFFSPLQFSRRRCIDFILGLSYHLAAFHSSVFIKQREQRDRKTERERDRKRPGTKFIMR